MWRTHILPLYLGADGVPDARDPDFDNPQDPRGQPGGKMQAYFDNGKALTCSTTKQFEGREQPRYYSWETEGTGTFALNSNFVNKPMHHNDINKTQQNVYDDRCSSGGVYPSDRGQRGTAVEQSPFRGSHSLARQFTV